MLGLLFFRSGALALVLALLGSFCALLYGESLWYQKRKAAFLEGFQLLLTDLLLYLRSGKSLENAMILGEREIDERMYGKLKEAWQRMLARMRTRERVEESLMSLAKECGLEEVEGFARAVGIGKRGEGDLRRIMENAVGEVREHLEMEKEMNLLLSKKKLEGRIVAAMPLGLFAMLSLMAPDYLSVLYEAPLGQLFLWISLGLMGLGIIFSMMIVRIDY